MWRKWLMVIKNHQSFWPKPLNICSKAENVIFKLDNEPKCAFRVQTNKEVTSPGDNLHFGMSHALNPDLNLKENLQVTGRHPSTRNTSQPDRLLYNSHCFIWTLQARGHNRRWKNFEMILHVVSHLTSQTTCHLNGCVCGLFLSTCTSAGPHCQEIGQFQNKHQDVLIYWQTQASAAPGLWLWSPISQCVTHHGYMLSHRIPFGLSDVYWWKKVAHNGKQEIIGLLSKMVFPCWSVTCLSTNSKQT